MRSNNIKKSEGHPRLAGLAKIGGTKNKEAKKNYLKELYWSIKKLP